MEHNNNESKEDFCTSCSIQVPSAFADDDDEEFSRINKKKRKNMFTNCNIMVISIICLLLYLIFIKK